MSKYIHTGRKFKVGDFIEVEELEEINLNENEGIVIDSSKFQGNELRYCQQNLQGKIVKHPILGDILLNRKGRVETYFRSPKPYLAIICFIDKIIETGYCNGVPEDLEYKRSSGTIFQFYRIHNVVTYDNKEVSVSVLIAEDIKGKKYYMFKADQVQENLMSNEQEFNNEPNRLHQVTNIITESNKSFKYLEQYDLKKIKNLNEQINSIIETTDREAQSNRIRNRKKSNATKQAWKKHHYNYMKGNRKKSRDNMNSFLAIAKELDENLKIIEAKMERDNTFDYKAEISFENLMGGLSFSINKDNGNVSFSTYLSENVGKGNYKLENGSNTNNELNALYASLKDELLTLSNIVDESLKQILAKYGLKETF